MVGLEGVPTTDGGCELSIRFLSESVLLLEALSLVVKADCQLAGMV